MEESELIKLIESGDEMRKFSDYFELRGFLGKGAFGIVVRARNLTTDQMVAIKVYLQFSLGGEQEGVPDRRDELAVTRGSHPVIIETLKHCSVHRFERD